MRFILVGGLNTLITMGLFYVLTPLLGHVLAYSLVYVFGIAFAYALNTLFVFEVSKSWKTAALYQLIYVVKYLYGLVMMILIVDYFDLNEMLVLSHWPQE
jgi:putative flippase GtrA